MLVAIFLLIPAAAFVILALAAMFRVRDPDYVRIGFGKWRFIQVGRATPEAWSPETDQRPAAQVRPSPARTLPASTLPASSDPRALPSGRPPRRRPDRGGPGRSQDHLTGVPQTCQPWLPRLETSVPRANRALAGPETSQKGNPGWDLSGASMGMVGA